MEEKTNPTIESIEETIQYFAWLSQKNPAEVVRQKFRASLVARLEKFLDGNAKATTKAAVRDFFRKCADDCLDEIEPSLEDACKKTKEYLIEAKNQAQKINSLKYEREDLEWELASARGEIKSLEERKKELEEQFPDQKARAAYEIYCRVSTPEDSSEDSYTKRCRIHNAAMMAAAYLGLQSYEINSQRNQEKKDQ